MVFRTFGLSVGFCWGLSAAMASAFALDPLPPASAVKYGGYVTDVFKAAYKEWQVNFEVDIEKSTGFYEGAHGMIAVPAKGLSEEQVSKDLQTPKGAGLCNLYLSAPYRLLIDGKIVPDSKLRFAKGLGNDGEPTQSACYLCTIRQIAGGGRELCLFGAEKEPLLTAKFASSSDTATRDFTFTAAPDKDHQLALVISIFGQSAAPLLVRVITPAAPADDAPPSTVNDEKGAANSKHTQTIAGKHARHSAASPLQSANERNGYVPDGKSLPKRPRIVWRYPGEGKGTVPAPGDPVVAGGVIYFGDESGQLHAIDSGEGNEKWVQDYSPHQIIAAPVVVQQNLYVASVQNMRCVSCQTGQTVWSRDLPKSFGESSPLVVGDVVMVGCGDGLVRALRTKTGEPAWQADLIADRPADLTGFDTQYLRRDGIAAHFRSAASDGTLLFQPIYDQSRTVALDCRTGQRRWTYSARGWISQHPAVAGDSVLFGSDDMYLHCVNRLTGKSVWKFPAGAEVNVACAVGNGRAYCTSLNARLHCVDLETGQPVWMHRLDPEVEGRLVLSAPLATDDTVYVGTAGGFLIAIDSSTGNSRWSISVADNMPINGSTLATDGKRLFATSRSDRFPRGPSGIIAIGD